MKKQITTMLYDTSAFGEVAFKVGGQTYSPGEQMPVNSQNTPAGYPAGKPYITISRIITACEKSPIFNLRGHDVKNRAYGTLQIRGDEALWLCDGKTIYTNLDEELDDEDMLTEHELYRIALYPLVAWTEGNVDEMKNFREKYRAGTASLNECLKFIASFEMFCAQNNPEIEVVFGASDSKCQPAVETDVIVSDAKQDKPSGYNLPWQQHPEIPNNLSIESAIAGKYNLAGQWGVITEGDKSYDFGADMVSADMLTEYIDNPDFHDNLQQVIGYVGSLFRANNLIWDGTPMNKFLEAHQIAMKRSNQQNIMLAGEPGSGKTVLCRTLAAALGIPCVVIRLGERSEKDELTQEVTATDHGFDTIKSQLYWYVKYGGLVIFDDLSNADPNMFFSVTGGLLEAPYEYMVNQETVKRHPLCIMMATTNVGTTGSQPINEALLTRFGGHYVVEKLSDDAFKACIMSRAQSNSGVVIKPKVQNTVASWTFNVFNAVSRAIKNVDRETADRLITMRAAIATAEKILNALADGFPVDAKKAACQTMANILYTGGNPTLQKAVADAIDNTPSLNI